MCILLAQRLSAYVCPREFSPLRACFGRSGRLSPPRSPLGTRPWPKPDLHYVLFSALWKCGCIVYLSYYDRLCITAYTHIPADRPNAAVRPSGTRPRFRHHQKHNITIIIKKSTRSCPFCSILPSAKVTAKTGAALSSCMVTRHESPERSLPSFDS